MALRILPRNKSSFLFCVRRMLELPLTISLSFPERVSTHWRRFSTGLWRLGPGDIASAYSAETFPCVKTFLHDGFRFTNCGTSFSNCPIRSSVDAYPLLPLDIKPLPEKKQYSYQGLEVKFGRQSFVLGSKVVFESSDPSVDEWRNLLRIVYADGGYFASQPSYREFLTLYTEKTGNIREALVLEGAHKIAEFSKEKVQNYIATPKDSQLSLF
jgi:hypothetical protein